jgi:S-adenosylmethionine uptake transporter
MMSALLGFNANMLFYCLLKAFQTLQLSQVASLRYLELVLAIAAGFFIFQETPSVQTLIGGCIVTIGATLAMTESNAAVK